MTMSQYILFSSLSIWVPTHYDLSIIIRMYWHYLWDYNIFLLILIHFRGIVHVKSTQYIILIPYDDLEVTKVGGTIRIYLIELYCIEYSIYHQFAKALTSNQFFVASMSSWCCHLCQRDCVCVVIDFKWWWLRSCNNVLISFMALSLVSTTCVNL